MAISINILSLGVCWSVSSVCLVFSQLEGAPWRQVFSSPLTLLRPWGVLRSGQFWFCQKGSFLPTYLWFLSPYFLTVKVPLLNHWNYLNYLISWHAISMSLHPEPNCLKYMCDINIVSYDICYILYVSVYIMYIIYTTYKLIYNTSPLKYKCTTWWIVTCIYRSV